MPRDCRLAKIDPAVFRAIVTFFDVFQRGVVILPNLRAIRCWDNLNSDGQLWELIPFLSPSLRYFSLRSHRQLSLPALGLLSALPSKSPSIRQLHVSLGGRDNIPERCIPAVSTCISCLPHLSTFESLDSPISHDAIVFLASLPNLCNLGLHISEDYRCILSTTLMPAAPFPFLRTLKLNCQFLVSGIDCIRTFLRSAFKLSSITMRTHEPPSRGQPSKLFSALSSHISHQSLTSLDVYYEGFPHMLALEPIDFDPLLKFTNLTIFHLHLYSSLEHLTDNLLEAISIAWPQLKSFDIASLGAPIGVSQCTFHGILLLMERCPNLYELTLPFMASTPIAYNGRPGGGVVNGNMVTLDVLRSPIDDPCMVASILSDVCPNLKDISAWDGNYGPWEGDDWWERNHDNPHKKRWDEAIKLYGTLAKVRKKERMWAAHRSRERLRTG
jgi:hypothetical protein